jgi:uncharacterized protein YkwD
MNKLILIWCFAIPFLGLGQLHCDSVTGKRTYHMTDDDFNFLDSIVPTYNKEKIEKEFIILLNKYRKEKGLDTLTVSKIASDASKYQSEYSFKIRKLTHETPYNGYETITARLRTFGLIESEYMKTGECGMIMTSLGLRIDRVGFAQGILQKWKNSPGHNRILLNEKVKNVGICISRGEDGPLFCFLVVHE